MSTVDFAELVEIDGVKRIRATKTHPYFARVRAGTLGGIVPCLEVLQDEAWIDYDAIVNDKGSVVRGYAYLGANSIMHGNSVMEDSTYTHNTILKNSVMRDCAYSNGGEDTQKAILLTSSTMSGNARIFNTDAGGSLNITNSVLGSNAQINRCRGLIIDSLIRGNDRMYFDDQALDLYDAAITKRSHMVVVGPIGSEGVGVGLYRRKNNDHHLHVGCWSGHIDLLLEEVEARSKNEWVSKLATEEQMLAWKQQYEGLYTLLKGIMNEW